MTLVALLPRVYDEASINDVMCCAQAQCALVGNSIGRKDFFFNDTYT